MAARLLIGAEPLVHTREDDLESFLQLLSWVALGFMTHKLNAEELGALLDDVFDHSWGAELAR